MTKELRSFKDSVHDGFYPGYFYSNQVENPLAVATMEHTHEAIRAAMDNMERDCYCRQRICSCSNRPGR